MNKNSAAALGVLLVAVLIGLLWLCLDANYSGHQAQAAQAASHAPGASAEA